MAVSACAILSYRASAGEQQLLIPLIPAPPEPTATLGLLYADPAGRVAMEYDLGSVNEDRVYFAPAVTSGVQDDALARALAYTPYLLGKYTASLGYRQLDLAFSVDGTPAQPALGTFFFGGTLCQWPYSSGLTIQRDRKPKIRVLFLKRRAQPKTEKYKLWCENGPGEVTLRTKFDVIAVSFFVQDSTHVLTAFNRPASVFRVNAQGTEIASPLANGVIAVPGDLAEDMYGIAARSVVPPQEAIDLFEVEVLQLASTKSGVEVP